MANIGGADGPEGEGQEPRVKPAKGAQRACDNGIRRDGRAV